ncbi:hypothetical protein TGPRC2_203505 [Toxoplasma gondii TgCatPRC2]|uniref:Uncharacterized protein n=1 Tax=Toxoplasma gondii TgCatPRC2 TaxID=1130821 RepID=A0A151HAS8_TOXGO|nr:hypothetical protein TGPRC2_203505 [Toxoplasma gondii TgCatPRC2]
MTHFSILNEHYARYMMLVRLDEAVGECRQHACCITKFSARVYLLPVQYVLFTTGAGAIDIICVTLQADLLDCQEAQRCSTDDTTGALKMSYIRQYVALSIELLGLLYSAYVFHALGFCQSHILPDEYGIPQHLCGLAKASITRKKLEARDPRLFDKGNTHVLFDPKDPLEIKWDTFTDTVLGEDRLSWPISRNNRRVSMVSEEELQYRIRILRKLGLPVEDYLKMREERECD